MPQITNTVVYMNSRAATDGYEHINIQGFLVGNAWTDASKDNQGAVFDWFVHDAASTFQSALTVTLVPTQLPHTGGRMPSFPMKPTLA